jgi:hypothetical protein
MSEEKPISFISFDHGNKRHLNPKDSGKSSRRKTTRSEGLGAGAEHLDGLIEILH